MSPEKTIPGPLSVPHDIQHLSSFQCPPQRQYLAHCLSHRLFNTCRVSNVPRKDNTWPTVCPTCYATLVEFPMSPAKTIPGPLSVPHDIQHLSSFQCPPQRQYLAHCLSHMFIVADLNEAAWTSAELSHREHVLVGSDAPMPRFNCRMMSRFCQHSDCLSGVTDGSEIPLDVSFGATPKVNVIGCC